jgi:hypothetical protein
VECEAGPSGPTHLELTSCSPALRVSAGKSGGGGGERDDSRQSTSTVKLHPQSTSAIEQGKASERASRQILLAPHTQIIPTRPHF